ncbi:hypothetical protein ACFVWG_15250 [Kribbella sp. NPDC058245]|uniref:hypothetical protein n=1 Tax=Kribbella sp. NPDC058245 TaxID=3346399 RepID=UPI0036E4AAC5
MRTRLATTGATALLAGVLALTAAGCGGSDDPKAVSTPAGQPSSDPGTPTTGAGSAEGDLPDPCKGWTEADVTTLTGLKIAPDADGARGGPEPYQPGDSQRACIWGVDGGHFLIGTQRTKADEFSGPGGDSEIVDGIGDQAYFIKSNNELHVRKDDLEIVVSFTKDESESGDVTLIPVQKTIATKILETAAA